MLSLAVTREIEANAGAAESASSGLLTDPDAAPLDFSEAEQERRDHDKAEQAVRAASDLVADVLKEC